MLESVLPTTGAAGAVTLAGAAMGAGISGTPVCTGAELGGGSTVFTIGVVAASTGGGGTGGVDGSKSVVGISGTLEGAISPPALGAKAASA